MNTILTCGIGPCRSRGRTAPAAFFLRARGAGRREPLVGAAPGGSLHGAPLFALDLAIAPIWAHAFLMLFAVFPTVIFGFLFTVYPRWMNGPGRARRYLPRNGRLVERRHAGLARWHLRIPVFAACRLRVRRLGLVIGIAELIRVLVAAPQIVSHAIVTLLALCVQLVALAGFTYGVAQHDDIALHYAARVALWGGLLPVFFAVCHRMIPFFSQNVVPGYVAWRPLWILVAVVALAYARLLIGAIGALAVLPFIDAALFVLTALCAVRWTASRARGNPLLGRCTRVRMAAHSRAAADRT